MSTPKKKKFDKTKYTNDYIRKKYVRKQVNIPVDVWDDLADKIPDGMFARIVISLLKEKYKV